MQCYDFILVKDSILLKSADGLPFLACPRKGSKRKTPKRGFKQSRPSLETPPETKNIGVLIEQLFLLQKLSFKGAAVSLLSCWESATKKTSYRSTLGCMHKKVKIKALHLFLRRGIQKGDVFVKSPPFVPFFAYFLRQVRKYDKRR